MPRRHRGRIRSSPMSASVDSSPSEPKGDAQTSRPPVNKRVFIAAAVGTLAITIWALISPSNAEAVLGAVVRRTSAWCVWFFVPLVLAVRVFVIHLAASRYGNTKLGPEHSKPEFGLVASASMPFPAGISTDLMVFAVSEPVTMYLQPPSTE